MTLGRNASLPPVTPEDNSDNWKKRQRSTYINSKIMHGRDKFINIWQHSKKDIVLTTKKDVVMVNVEEKNRGKWKTGVLEELHIVT